MIKIPRIFAFFFTQMLTLRVLFSNYSLLSPPPSHKISQFPSNIIVKQTNHLTPRQNSSPSPLSAQEKKERSVKNDYDLFTIYDPSFPLPSFPPPYKIFAVLNEICW